LRSLSGNTSFSDRRGIDPARMENNWVGRQIKKC
jgi:hypothetical protein